MRFDPFRDFDRLTRNFPSHDRNPWMSLDAYRNGDHVVLHLDLPGVDPDSVDVTVENDTLTVKAERNWEVAEGDRVLVSERPRGKFVRRLLLGEALDGDHTEARYDNGVLSLTIPVAAQAKPRKVEIASGPRPIESEAAAA